MLIIFDVVLAGNPNDMMATNAAAETFKERVPILFWRPATLELCFVRSSV